MIRHLVICLAVVWLSGPWVAAQTPSAFPDAASATAADSAPPDYVIGPQDVLEILFWRDKDLSAEVIVRPDGKITLPLINEIDAAGLTPDQLRARVREQANRFVEDAVPVVNVKQINSRRVFIVGEVAKPGAYPLGGPTSVLQLIATAGGLGEFASSDKIVVIRTVAGRQVRYHFNYEAVVRGNNLKQNIELKSGDTVIVP